MSLTALRDRMHILIAVFATVAGILLTAIGIASSATSMVIILALPIALGAAAHVAYSHRTSTGLHQMPSGGFRLAMVGSLLTIAGVAAAILLFDRTVVRPDAYFALMVMVTVGILLQGRAAHNDGKILVWVLLQGLTLAVLLRGHALFESPGLTISDIMSHKQMILAWAEAGHLLRWHPIHETWFGYHDWPLMHISVITTTLTTGLAFKPALFIAVGIPFVASLLFVYLLAARDYGRSSGILALVFVVTAAPHVFWGAVLIPTTMGVTLFCGVLYTTMFWRSSITHAVVFLILSVALVLTHTASAFITLIAVTVVVVIGSIGSRINMPNRTSVATPGCVVLLTALLIGKWQLSYHAPDTTFLQVVTRGLVDSVRDLAGPTPSIVYSANQNPLDWLWLGAAALFLATGALACLHPVVRSQHRLVDLAVVATLCVAVVGFPLLGMRNILPHRWLPFIFSSGAALAALGLTWASTVFRPNKTHAFQVTVLAAFAALSLFSTSVHPKTPLSTVPGALSWTASEVAAGQMIARWFPDTITTDRYYKDLGGELPLGQTVQWNPLSTEVPCRGIVVVRHAVRETMCEGDTGTWQAGYGDDKAKDACFFASVADCPYSQVYANPAVSAFFASGQP